MVDIVNPRALKRLDTGRCKPRQTEGLIRSGVEHNSVSLVYKAGILGQKLGGGRAGVWRRQGADGISPSIVEEWWQDNSGGNRAIFVTSRSALVRL